MQCFLFLANFRCSYHTRARRSTHTTHHIEYCIRVSLGKRVKHFFVVLSLSLIRSKFKVSACVAIFSPGGWMFSRSKLKSQQSLKWCNLQLMLFYILYLLKKYERCLWLFYDSCKTVVEILLEQQAVKIKEIKQCLYARKIRSALSWWCTNKLRRNLSMISVNVN